MSIIGFVLLNFSRYYIALCMQFVFVYAFLSYIENTNIRRTGHVLIQFLFNISCLIFRRFHRCMFLWFYYVWMVLVASRSRSVYTHVCIMICCLSFCILDGRLYSLIVNLLVSWLIKFNSKLHPSTIKGAQNFVIQFIWHLNVIKTFSRVLKNFDGNKIGNESSKRDNDLIDKTNGKNNNINMYYEFNFLWQTDQLFCDMTIWLRSTLCQFGTWKEKLAPAWERSFQYYIYKKIFKRKDYLSGHFWSHTGEGLFLCEFELCGKRRVSPERATSHRKSRFNAIFQDARKDSSKEGT